MYHLRMNGSARDRMEGRGETGSEGGRERNIWRYVRQESEEERVCMNERAGITTSHINTVLGNPGGKQRSAQWHSFSGKPYTDINVCNAKTRADMSTTLFG